jgi:hypothetical protein
VLQEFEILDSAEHVKLDVGPIAHQPRHLAQARLALRRGELHGSAFGLERAEQIIGMPMIETSPCPMEWWNGAGHGLWRFLQLANRAATVPEIP